MKKEEQKAIWDAVEVLRSRAARSVGDSVGIGATVTILLGEVEDIAVAQGADRELWRQDVPKVADLLRANPGSAVELRPTTRPLS